MRPSRAQLVSRGEPVTVRGARVPHNVFALLGIEPILGRPFLAGEEQEGRDRVAILAESIWRSTFNADPSLVGRTIQLDGEPHQVVGIVPASFRLPLDNGSGPRFEIYRPLVLSAEDRSRTTGNFNFAAVVRLKRGVTVDQALADMNVVLGRFQSASRLQRRSEGQAHPGARARDRRRGSACGCWRPPSAPCCSLSA